MNAQPKPKQERRKRHKQTIECDISPEVRKVVYERDSVDGCPVCIVCGNPHNLEVAHYIPRSQGGKGIPENLVTLCKSCHKDYDEYRGVSEVERIIENHLIANSLLWDRSKLIYDKWRDLDPAYRFDNFVK